MSGTAAPGDPGDPGDPGARRAAAWVEHLRAGGTTPWLAWTEEARGGSSPVVPGAQQLELLRRVNLAGRPGPALVERILGASAVGRGQPDLPLVGSVPDSAWGAAPVDPAGLPGRELVRVAAMLLAEDLVAADPGPRPPARVPLRARVERRLRPRAAYRLVGDPWRAGHLRPALAAAGRPPGGPEPLVVVLAADLATALADLWLQRCFATRTQVVAWDAWLAEMQGAARLPRPVDAAAVAAAWARRVGRHRVRVALDDAALADLVGVRSVPARPTVPADGAELARRVSAALGLLVAPADGSRLLREVLLPRVRDLPGPPLGLPPEHHRWVARRSRRVRDGVRAGDYPVLGDVDDLVSRPRALARVEPGDASEERVLDHAVALLLAPVGAPVGAPGGAPGGPAGTPRTTDREERTP